MLYSFLNFEYKILKSEGNFIALKISNNFVTLQGLSITIGNALRRILLNNLMGTAIVKFVINKPTNDSVFVGSVKEDLFEIKNNIRKIILRSLKMSSGSAKLFIKGPAMVTASDLLLPENFVVVNPNQYLFTIVNDEVFDISFDIEQGFGYKFYNENYISFNDGVASKSIDANFSPIVKVNYKVILEESEVFRNKMVESLILEIWTNGSITPLRAFLESNKILSSIFASLIK